MRWGFTANDGLDIVITAAVYLGALLIALLIREFARARVGQAVGDHVPRMAGRLSPTVRGIVDPLGSIFFPVFAAVSGAISYAWATPLSYELGKPGPKRQVILSSLAGPAANLVVAALAARLLSPITQSVLAARLLGLFLLANVTMAVMHLLPIPPLDGSRILAVFLGPSGRARLERLESWGIAILFLLAFLGRGFLRNEPFQSIISAVRELIA